MSCCYGNRAYQDEYININMSFAAERLSEMSHDLLALCVEVTQIFLKKMIEGKKKSIQQTEISLFSSWGSSAAAGRLSH